MSAPIWTVAEVARALGAAGSFPDTPIDFVTQDSRLVKPGSLFVALSGTPSGGFISAFASARATSATVHMGALMQSSTLMRRRPPRDH